MVICEDRCSKSVRELAAEHGWILIEGIDSIPAMHACIAIEPESVCVELIRHSTSVPSLIRVLAECDSVDLLACYHPHAGDQFAKNLSRQGVRVITDDQELKKWARYTSKLAPSQQTTPARIGSRSRSEHR